LYQKGFLLAYAAPSTHPGTKRSFELQIGTLFCSNLVVPHTGKAVEGVWPSVVQACPKAEFTHTERKMIKNKIPDFADIMNTG
jgi:hypothetical protein